MAHKKVMSVRTVKTYDEGFVLTRSMFPYGVASMSNQSIRKACLYAEEKSSPTRE